MSEEKLYAVKNDEGKYWDFGDYDTFWPLNANICHTTSDEDEAKRVSNNYGGHVVTFVEEPKKVVLTEEQAKTVEDANNCGDSTADYISYRSDEKLLMNAIVNGYTVAKEKKYNVKVPHVSLYYWKDPEGEISINDLLAEGKDNGLKFTESEIEHYGLQDCEKEEVTDDGIR
jgi:hypothetical protein